MPRSRRSDARSGDSRVCGCCAQSRRASSFACHYDSANEICHACKDFCLHRVKLAKDKGLTVHALFERDSDEQRVERYRLLTAAGVNWDMVARRQHAVRGSRGKKRRSAPSATTNTRSQASRPCAPIVTKRARRSLTPRCSPVATSPAVSVVTTSTASDGSYSPRSDFDDALSDAYADSIFSAAQDAVTPNGVQYTPLRACHPSDVKPAAPMMVANGFDDAFADMDVYDEVEALLMNDPLMDFDAVATMPQDQFQSYMAACMEDMSVDIFAQHAAAPASLAGVLALDMSWAGSAL